MGALKASLLLGSLSFGFLMFVLPVYGKALGASALEIGGLFTAFSAMVLVIRPFAGRAMDRCGRRPFFIGGLIAYTMALAVFSQAHSLGALYLGRLLQGAGSAVLWVAAYSMAADSAREGASGEGMGTVDAAVSRGALFGAVVGFTLLGWFELNSGWKYLFSGYALAAALAVGLALAGVKETLPEKAAAADGAERFSPAFKKLLVVVALTGTASAAISPLLMIYLQERFTTDIILLAQAFIPAAVIGAALPPRAGKISDRYGRRGPVVAGLLLAAGAAFAMPGIAGYGWLIAVWAVEAVGVGLAGPALTALVADFTGSGGRGAGYGCYTLAAGAGAVAGPLVGGAIYDYAGYAAPFYLNGFIMLLCAWLVVRLLQQPARAGMEKPVP